MEEKCCVNPTLRGIRIGRREESSMTSRKISCAMVLAKTIGFEVKVRGFETWLAPLRSSESISETEFEIALRLFGDRKYREELSFDEFRDICVALNLLWARVRTICIPSPFIVRVGLCPAVGLYTIGYLLLIMVILYTL